MEKITRLSAGFFETVLAAKSAVSEYGSENVGVVSNEENGNTDIIFHNDRCSFPIHAGVAKLSENEKDVLRTVLDEIGVGYCF